MAVTIRGIVPLNWGTDTCSGYVVETTSDDGTTGESLIENEVGDPITQITGFGIKNEVTLDVIPKSSITTPPVAGDVLAYGATPKSMTILSIGKKRTNKGVEKWTIKGNYFPNISLS